MGSERIDPLFFGPKERRLFGCHHGPADGPPARLGLVIAPPLGHEYSRSHRALRQLAAACAANGLRALRFDFGGTGDSSGDEWPASLDAWREDLEIAQRELALRTRVARTALLGVRASALLALERAARSPALAALILWEPCLDAAAYARSLASLQTRFEATLPARAAGARTSSAGSECLGFLWPAALLEELNAWSPPSFEHARPSRALILESSPSSAAGDLAARLAKLGTLVHHERSSGSQPWNEDVDEGLVPAQDIRRVVQFLGEES